MKNYFQKKINFISLLCVIILSLINIINIIYNTPMIPDQHWAQKIFYVHVPSAWVGFLSYFVVMISGIMYSNSNDDKWDYVSLSAAPFGNYINPLPYLYWLFYDEDIWRIFGKNETKCCCFGYCIFY